MTHKLTAYISAVVGAAVACVALLYATGFGYENLPRETFFAVLAFSSIGLVAQVQVYRLPSSAAGSIAFLPFISAALLAPAWWTVVLVACCVALAELKRRPAAYKALFNVAQQALSLGVGLLVYAQLGGEPLQQGAPFNFLAYCALVTVFLGVNTLAVSGVVAVSMGHSVISVWRSNTLRLLAYDVVALPVVYCALEIYLKLGIPGVIVFAILVLGARELYSANLQLERANQDLLQVMVAAIEMRDPYTSGHSQRVARYSQLIGRATGLAPKDVERLAIAALLHDVGKIDQRFAEILQKPGRLTDEERLVIEEHPIRSAELVGMVSGLQDLVPSVRHHHERWDGAGYPDGIAGEAIPLFARIITFADTIDAMTSDRPYRPALGPADVRRELVKHRGKQFDPYICDRLLGSTEFEALFAAANKSGEVRTVLSLTLPAPEPSRREPVIAA